MDSAENLLPSSCELTQEADDVIGALPIETTGRFVKEEKEFRLGRQFDTDSHSFPGWIAISVTAILYRRQTPYLRLKDRSP